MNRHQPPRLQLELRNSPQFLTDSSVSEVRERNRQPPLGRWNSPNGENVGSRAAYLAHQLGPTGTSETRCATLARRHSFPFSALQCSNHSGWKSRKALVRQPGILDQSRSLTRLRQTIERLPTA